MIGFGKWQILRNIYIWITNVFKPGQYFSFPVSKGTLVVVRTYFFGFVFAISNNTQKASNVLLIHTVM